MSVISMLIFLIIKTKAFLVFVVLLVLLAKMGKMAGKEKEVDLVVQVNLESLVREVLKETEVNQALTVLTEMLVNLVQLESKALRAPEDQLDLQENLDKADEVIKDLRDHLDHVDVTEREVNPEEMGNAVVTVILDEMDKTVQMEKRAKKVDQVRTDFQVKMSSLLMEVPVLEDLMVFEVFLVCQVKMVSTAPTD